MFSVPLTEETFCPKSGYSSEELFMCNVFPLSGSVNNQMSIIP